MEGYKAVKRGVEPKDRKMKEWKLNGAVGNKWKSVGR